jgi:hypothetical protein
MQALTQRQVTSLPLDTPTPKIPFGQQDPNNLRPTGNPTVDKLLWLPGSDLFEDRPKAAKALWTFQCPICDNRVTSEQNLQPMCTGPGWQDTHPPDLMRYVDMGRNAKLIDSF